MSVRPGATVITILVDNRADEGLRSEHGFSVWIEVAGRRLLFDTGQGPALSCNAEQLGVDLRAAEILILSHGHYDHTGGVPLVVERAPAVQVYLHPAATGTRYAIRDGKAALDSLSDGAVHGVTHPIEVAAGAGVTGPIPRLTDYEDTGGPFFVDAEGSHRDPIMDDLALWIRTDRGLVVVVGCSHAGVINTLRHAQHLSREPRLHAVIGGFHLGAASGMRLERTMEALTDLAPDLIVPCHCTGDAAVHKLQQTFGARVVPGSAGARLSWSGASEYLSVAEGGRP